MTKVEKQVYDLNYRAMHREKRRLDHATYYTAHREHGIAKSRAYYQAHREQACQKAKSYRLAHGGEIKIRRAKAYATHRAENATRCAAYRRTEIGARIVREHVSRRRALMRQRTQVASAEVLTPEQWQKIIHLANKRCYWNWCHEKMTRPTQDHIIPFSKGGLHIAANVVAACQSCNSKKKDKVLTLL